MGQITTFRLYLCWYHLWGLTHYFLSKKTDNGENVRCLLQAQHVRWNGGTSMLERSLGSVPKRRNAGKVTKAWESILESRQTDFIKWMDFKDGSVNIRQHVKSVSWFENDLETACKGATSASCRNFNLENLKIDLTVSTLRRNWFHIRILISGMLNPVWPRSLHFSNRKSWFKDFF